MSRVTTVNLNIQVITVGSMFMAIGNMAGVTFRGTRQETRDKALLALFHQFTSAQNDDAALALDLASSGEDYAAIERDIQAASDEITWPALSGGSTEPVSDLSKE